MELDLNTLRNILFQIHLWVGLGLGLLFIALGLTGSLLVYPELMGQGRSAAPAISAQGPRLPLEQIIASARQAMPGNDNSTATVTLPRDDQAAGVRFAAARNGRTGEQRGREGGRDGRPEGRDGGGRGGQNGPQTFVDPVSGKVLATVTPRPSPLVGIVHQLHENMMLGRQGRILVGILGIGMLFLGLSGLYLWWPRAGQWKYAFIVRPTARGARLFREIHGAFGIWWLVVFLVVTITGIPLAFPSLMNGGGRDGGDGRGGDGPRGVRTEATLSIDAPEGAKMLPLAQLVAAAEQHSGLKATAVTVPARAGRAVTVTLARGGEDGPPVSARVNPYTGETAMPAVAARPESRGLNMRSLHAGEGLGPIWKILVFTSGFLPLLFVVTGFLMWLKKRQARRKPA